MELDWLSVGVALVNQATGQVLRRTLLLTAWCSRHWSIRTWPQRCTVGRITMNRLMYTCLQWFWPVYNLGGQFLGLPWQSGPPMDCDQSSTISGIHVFETCWSNAGMVRLQRVLAFAEFSTFSPSTRKKSTQEKTLPRTIASRWFSWHLRLAALKLLLPALAAGVRYFDSYG